MSLISDLKAGKKNYHIKNRMVKKINHDAITIKKLLSKGYTQARICRLLGLKKQKVSYWAKTPIKYEIKRKTKLDEKYKKRIVELAEHKLTSDIDY